MPLFGAPTASSSPERETALPKASLALRSARAQELLDAVALGVVGVHRHCADQVRTEGVRVVGDPDREVGGGRGDRGTEAAEVCRGRGVEPFDELPGGPVEAVEIDRAGVRAIGVVLGRADQHQVAPDGDGLAEADGVRGTRQHLLFDPARTVVTVDDRRRRAQARRPDHDAIALNGDRVPEVRLEVQLGGAHETLLEGPVLAVPAVDPDAVVVFHQALAEGPHHQRVAVDRERASEHLRLRGVRVGEGRFVGLRLRVPGRPEQADRQGDQAQQQGVKAAVGGAEVGGGGHRGGPRGGDGDGLAREATAPSVSHSRSAAGAGSDQRMVAFRSEVLEV